MHALFEPVFKSWRLFFKECCFGNTALREAQSQGFSLDQLVLPTNLSM